MMEEFSRVVGSEREQGQTPPATNRGAASVESNNKSTQSTSSLLSCYLGLKRSRVHHMKDSHEHREGQAGVLISSWLKQRRGNIGG